MDRLDRLEQVVSKAEQLLEDIKALKGEPSKAEQIKDLCNNAKVYHSDFSCALLHLMGGEYNNKKETV